MSGIVRTAVWSQLQMFTRPPTASTVDAQPPTVARASRTTTCCPARARYAAHTSPLCPAPTTMTSGSRALSWAASGTGRSGCALLTMVAIFASAVGASAMCCRLQLDRGVDELVGDDVARLQVLLDVDV